MNFKITQLIPVAALVCVGLASCKKNDAVSKPSSQASEQQARTTNLIDLGQNEVASEVSDLVSVQADQLSCKVITYSPSKDVYPHLKTIDYGTGCSDGNGIIYSGKKLVTEYVDWRTAAAGTKISVSSFSDYIVNNLNITGSSVTYLLGISNSGNPTFKTVLTKTVTDGQGNNSTYVGSVITKRVPGGDEEGDEGKFLELRGTTWGTEINNYGTTLATWKAVIDQSNPVVKKADCNFRSKGGVNIEIARDGSQVATDTEYLNYGNGDCDNKATLTVNGGTEETVTLPFFFYTAHL